MNLSIINLLSANPKKWSNTLKELKILKDSMNHFFLIQTFSKYCQENIDLLFYVFLCNLSVVNSKMVQFLCVYSFIHFIFVSSVQFTCMYFMMNKKNLGETSQLFKKRYCCHASPKSDQRTNITEVFANQKVNQISKTEVFAKIVTGFSISLPGGKLTSKMILNVTL